jgi:hypothetical protein
MGDSTVLARANVVNRAVRRAAGRRRLAAALLLGVLAGTSACSADASDGTGEDRKSVGGEPSSAPSTPETEAPVLSAGTWRIKDVVIEDRVDGLKGPGAGAEVRDLMLRIARDHTFNEQSYKYDDKLGRAESTRWMLSARKDMTADAARDWTSTVNTYFREKKADGTDAWNSMMSWTTYGMYDKAMRPTDPTVPLMFDRTVKSLDIDLSTDGRVWVTMKTGARFNFVNKGTPAVSRADRTQEFWLREVDGRWKVDGWNGTVEFALEKD